MMTSRIRHHDSCSGAVVEQERQGGKRACYHKVHCEIQPSKKKREEETIYETLILLSLSSVGEPVGYHRACFADCAEAAYDDATEDDLPRKGAA